MVNYSTKVCVATEMTESYTTHEMISYGPLCPKQLLVTKKKRKKEKS